MNIAPIKNTISFGQSNYIDFPLDPYDKKDPRNPFEKGLNHYGNRKFDDAISQFEKAVELSPNNRYHRAFALLSWSHYKAALDHYKKVVEYTDKMFESEADTGPLGETLCNNGRRLGSRYAAKALDVIADDLNPIRQKEEICELREKAENYRRINEIEEKYHILADQ
ncbi:MAG: hypothetical protein A2Y25_10860 [Candidatus Melainabacteria bacterium GWF2_37_15]|nr:MAG: hypothetical protein A2Y25_10860 [Candidatus Melainabacteria bacterium GWF2_37_15]